MRQIQFKRAKNIVKLFGFTDVDLSVYTNGIVKPSVVKSTAQFLLNNLPDEDVKKLNQMIK